ncbi:Alpha/Beta hydrolase protein [Dactylonectria estremocensis]|uniref:Alpha/Beta hydrolase protein n=1 Tax=Dactylonectria estremocensis TaxID=1079267 RepID=A0A9P9F3Z8_9HYPO|nr:Alpha/Beta hydrolase protein [Dactylonectria estremocensis]
MASTTSHPTYESQSAWKDIQTGFLPKRLRFTAAHAPAEEWWDNRGHRLHLDRWRSPGARTRVVLHHGVGTNGRQMSMILGVPLHEAGFDVVAVDMPGYGQTRVAPGSVCSYDDWVAIGSDFVDHELSHDARPIVLYGLSAGGMLAYHIAALNKKVVGVIGMTFLDQRIPQVTKETSHDFLMASVGMSMARLCSRIPLLCSLAVPMRLASKMSALVNNPSALAVLLADKTSAGSWATMRFLGTYAVYAPAMEPEAFDVCPILLTQPAEDRWTPLHLSELVLDRIVKVPVTKVLLTNAGHYPLEDPGLQEMADAIIQFLHEQESQF